MLYIKNNLDYAIGFRVKRGKREETFEFDCFRQYLDTGVVATTGVTEVREEDYNYLVTECKQFKKYIEKGYLSKTEKAGALAVADKMDELEKENNRLKAELEKAKKEVSAPVDNEEVKKLSDENITLKAELEALKKGGKKGKVKGKNSDTDTEGF